jgi:hypothetical protein
MYVCVCMYVLYEGEIDKSEFLNFLFLKNWEKTTQTMRDTSPRNTRSLNKSSPANHDIFVSNREVFGGNFFTSRRTNQRMIGRTNNIICMC